MEEVLKRMRKDVKVTFNKNESLTISYVSQALARPRGSPRDWPPCSFRRMPGTARPGRKHQPVSRLPAR